MQIEKGKKFSKFFEKKNEARKIDFLVLHHIEASSADQAIDLLTNNEVSAHYLIDEQGKVFELVDENDIAYHAGTSYWHGFESLNKNSIGIEFINSTPFEKKFEAAQMQAGVELCKFLMEKHGIKGSNVVSHSDIAYYPVPYPSPAPGEDEGLSVAPPEVEQVEEKEKEAESKETAKETDLLDRKQDPSHLFDWKFLAENGVGIYPATAMPNEDKILFKVGDKSEEIKELKVKLSRFGYRLVHLDDEFNREMKHLVRVFNRHFNGGKFAESLENWYLSSEMILDEMLRAESGTVRM